MATKQNGPLINASYLATTPSKRGKCPLPLPSPNAIAIAYCHCHLSLPIADCHCHCLLLLPVAIAIGYCLLLLPVATAYCYCILLLPIATAYCYCLSAYCYCPLLLPIVFFQAPAQNCRGPQLSEPRGPSHSTRAPKQRPMRAIHRTQCRPLNTLQTRTPPARRSPGTRGPWTRPFRKGLVLLQASAFCSGPRPGSPGRSYPF